MRIGPGTMITAPETLYGDPQNGGSPANLLINEGVRDKVKCSLRLLRLRSCPGSIINSALCDVSRAIIRAKLCVAESTTSVLSADVNGPAVQGTSRKLRADQICFFSILKSSEIHGSPPIKNKIYQLS